ncbi:M23 family metallopeptidase [Sphingomonas sp. ac-8]|uniref:M23 family metallopeptidase n=1 Tax=Sphingomonas sp. ac-8 TaxID=3242977 RepID=UPI003A7F939F
MRLLLALLVLVPAAAGAREKTGLRVSSRFGVRADPLNGGRAVHRGVDLPGVVGTPVVAAASGVVCVAARRGGYGDLIELAHPDGTTTRYAHLSRILVRPGETVVQGQVIGRMGSTGRSTGSHLHFEYRVHGVPVDPLRYLSAAATPASEAVAGPVVQPAAPELPHRSRFSQARAAQAPRSPQELPGGADALRGPPR